MSRLGEAERELSFTHGRWSGRLNITERCVDINLDGRLFDALNKEIGFSQGNLERGNALFIPQKVRSKACTLFNRFFLLQSCPFCGARTARFDDSTGSCEVECGSCGAYTWGETPIKAVKAWNRRAS